MMKNQLKSEVGSRKSVKTFCAACLGAAALLASSEARAGDWNYTDIPLGSLTTAAGGSVTNTSATAFDIPANTPAAFQFTYYGTNTLSDTFLAYRLNLSSDGTNFSTIPPLNFTNVPTSTATNRSWNTVTAAQLVGAKKGRLDVVSTSATNSITTTAGKVGFFY